MTEIITAEGLEADMALDAELKERIKDCFDVAVERQVDEALEAMAALNDAAEAFFEFLDECGIDDPEEAFNLFVIEHEIDEEDAEVLAGFLNDRLTNEEAIDEGRHCGSWEMPDKSVLHAYDRGKKYHTLKRFVLRHYSPDKLHIATHFAGTAPDAEAIIDTLAGKLKSPVKEDRFEQMAHTPLMEAYVRYIEKPEEHTNFISAPFRWN